MELMSIISQIYTLGTGLQAHCNRGWTLLHTENVELPLLGVIFCNTQPCKGLCYGGGSRVMVLIMHLFHLFFILFYFPNQKAYFALCVLLFAHAPKVWSCPVQMIDKISDKELPTTELGCHKNLQVMNGSGKSDISGQCRDLSWGKVG